MFKGWAKFHDIFIFLVKSTAMNNCVIITIIDASLIK